MLHLYYRTAWTLPAAYAVAATTMAATTDVRRFVVAIFAAPHGQYPLPLVSAWQDLQ